MTHTPDSDELAGLLAALPHLTGDAKQMATDAVLDRLDRTAPQVARIVASVVGALDPSTAAAIAERFPEYDGGLPLDPPNAPLVDCLVLTIKEVEWRATLAAFDVPMSHYTFVRDLPVHYIERDDLRFAISSVGNDGNTESAIMFGRLYEALRPRAAVLVGMAGGVAEKVVQGDVVVAKQVHAYDFRKLSAKYGELNRAKTYRVPDRLTRQAESMKLFHRPWYLEVNSALRGVLANDEYDTSDSIVPPESWRPTVVAGDILAGGSLVEDGSLPEWARSFNENVKAAEMEGAGFAAACTEVAIPWMVIRGVADAGEEGREDGWQFAATFAAASWLRTALSIKMIDLTSPSSH